MDINLTELSELLRGYEITARGARTLVAHVRSVAPNGATINHNPIMLKAHRDWPGYWTTIARQVYHDGRRSWRWVPICAFPTLAEGVQAWMNVLGERGIRAANRGPNAYAMWAYKSKSSYREPNAFADALRRNGAS